MSRHELPRTSGAVVRDDHSWEDWRQALVTVDASYALEAGEVGVYVEHVTGEDGAQPRVRLHVPAIDGEHRPITDETIRDAVAAAAGAVGLHVTETDPGDERGGQ